MSAVAVQYPLRDVQPEWIHPIDSHFIYNEDLITLTVAAVFGFPSGTTGDKNDCQDERANGATRGPAFKRKFRQISIQDGENETEEESKTPIILKRAEKRVKFSSECKFHDGLCVENERFDKMISQLFVQRDVDGVLEACKALAEEPEAEVQMTSLHEKTSDLINRIKRDTSSTPVLPSGGGSCIKLNTSHLEALEWVQLVLKILLGHEDGSDGDDEEKGK